MDLQDLFILYNCNSIPIEQKAAHFSLPPSLGNDHFILCFYKSSQTSSHICWVAIIKNKIKMTCVNENIQKLVYLHTVSRKKYGVFPKLKTDYHMIQTFYYWVFIQNNGNRDFERVFALSCLFQHNSQKKIRKHLKSPSINKWMKKT